MQRGKTSRVDSPRTRHRQEKPRDRCRGSALLRPRPTSVKRRRSNGPEDRRPLPYRGRRDGPPRRRPAATPSPQAARGARLRAFNHRAHRVLELAEQYVSASRSVAMSSIASNRQFLSAQRPRYRLKRIDETLLRTCVSMERRRQRTPKGREQHPGDRPSARHRIRESAEARALRARSRSGQRERPRERRTKAPPPQARAQASRTEQGSVSEDERASSALRRKGYRAKLPARHSGPRGRRTSRERPRAHGESLPRQVPSEPRS